MASVILVEGEDDKRVVLRIMEQIGMEAGVDVEPANGINDLIGTIAGAIKEPGRKSVGIVADANDDPDARWAGLCKPLQGLRERQEYDFGLLGNPVPGGLVRKDRETGVRVGIWLMPDNQRPGEVENFVVKMVPDGDPDWQGAEEYVQQVANTSSVSRKRTVVANKPRKIEGSALRVWLATGSEPHHMGYAIARKDLSIDGPLCSEFCAWLRELLA